MYRFIYAKNMLLGAGQAQQAVCHLHSCSTRACHRLPRCSGSSHQQSAQALSISHGLPNHQQQLQRHPSSSCVLSSRRAARARLRVHASGDSGRSSSSAEGWTWKSPDWRALQRKGRAAGTREVERSALVNEEIVYFIFQLELDAQLQRALNYEAYEAAQQIRIKRETVDLALRDMLERKAASVAASMSEEDAVGAGVAQASLDLSDTMSEGLRLRSEMQRAVQEERYSDAAKFRDMLAALDRQAKQAAALAAEADATAAGKQLQLRLGQRVVHKEHGYRGVVVGWDVGCCEGEEWQERAGAEQLKNGLSQPFYHLLVEVSDWGYDASQPPVAYVAQELLAAPEVEDDGATWAQVYGTESLQHPYSYVLFLGQDARGDMLPCRQLRDKYGARRRDVYKPGSEPSEEGEGDEEGGDGEGRGGGGGGNGGAGPKGSGGGGGGGRVVIPGIDMSSLDDA